MTAEEKKRLREWKEYLEDVKNSTPIEAGLSETERKKKKEYLESKPEEWIAYFFPKYAKYPFAKFQKKAIKRILDNPEWFEVLSWSRDLAKSTIVMFCVMYLALTGRKKNVIIASATQTSAEKLLMPYRANFEGNGRIKAFYGNQVVPGRWTDSDFTAKCGCSFYAIGAGNAPRGSRNEEVRPDVILVDDFDTDEDCRNPVTLDKKWSWWEKALYPTRDISEKTLIVFCGNIIAKDTCVARAGAKADHWDIINIVDKDGNSTWPEKNTQEHIQRIRNSISTAAYQGEYMNNPISEGKIFANLTFGRVPPLEKFKFLVAYGDPSYSNRKNKEASMKSVCLMGRLKTTYYIIKCFLTRCTNAEYIEWFYLMKQYVSGRTTLYCVQENNSLQDPFFQQVFKPLIWQANRDRRENLNIIPDGRDKMDKASRIEANLEPLDRNGLLVFNEEEKDNPHMQEMRDQFSLFELSLPYCADGPDSAEGACNFINRKMKEMEPIVTISYRDMEENNRFRT